MKIAFAYGKYAAGGKLLTPETMTTGSEWSCAAYAREMRRRGHDISLYLPHKRPYEIFDSWEDVRVRELNFLRSERHDVVIAWNEPDLLREVYGKPLRVVNQQLNDFWYASPNYDEVVDIYTSPSESHLYHLRDQTQSPHKWRVLPNGCDPALYHPTGKVPGRVIYASSPDRGLHQLLPLWSAIKKQVPEAYLKIFYNLQPWFQLASLPDNQLHPRHVESKKRAIETLKLIPGLDRGWFSGRNDGIEIVGPIPRSQMIKEMNEAMVLAYPCDPYTWTEGFSVTTLEACAAGCIPVITDADALGELYSDACPMVKRPRVGKIADGYVDLVVKALTDKTWGDSVRNKCLALAQNYNWSVLAEKLEKIIC